MKGLRAASEEMLFLLSFFYLTLFIFPIHPKESEHLKCVYCVSRSQIKPNQRIGDLGPLCCWAPLCLTAVTTTFILLWYISVEFCLSVKLCLS